MISFRSCEKLLILTRFSKYLCRVTLEAIAERNGSFVCGDKKSGVRSPFRSQVRIRGEAEEETGR